MTYAKPPYTPEIATQNTQNENLSVDYDNAKGRLIDGCLGILSILSTYFGGVGCLVGVPCAPSPIKVLSGGRANTGNSNPDFFLEARF
jgi:hypothetical protein